MPLNVWMVNPYGALPGEAWREYRTTLAARCFLEAGHAVTWWTSNFEHRAKRFRSPGPEHRTIEPGFDIRIVPTSGYTRHVSLARVRFERTFAMRFREEARSAGQPDVIVLGEPALFTAAPVVEVADRLRIPIVLDIGDLWPELFQIVLPRALRPVGRILFDPLYRRRRRLLRRADGYVAVTADYLAQMMAEAPKQWASVAYWGVDVQAVERELAAPTALPDAMRSRPKRPEDIWAIYAGTLGPNYDMRTILAAANRLLKDDATITIFLAGDGASKGEVIETIRRERLANCVFLGALPAATVTKVYSRCDIALSSYVGDSTVSMPIKAFDYLAAGLPIVNSLGRDLGALVRSRRVGLQYAAEDPGSLADALRRLASEPRVREEMSRNARILGREFDYRVQYRKYVETVTSAVASHRAARTAVPR